MAKSPAVPYKTPISAQVLVYTPELHVLLLERADFPGYWQSVTGSMEPGEALAQTATRELFEETGIDALAYGGVVDWGVANDYEIFAQWRHRYPAGTTHNTEHVFGLEVPRPLVPRLHRREHIAYAWLPWQQAAEKCFSWTNRAAIEALARRVCSAARADA